MTPGVITFLPEAEEEIEASVRWYEHRRRGLGLEFIAALDRALTRIAEKPREFQKWPDEPRYRRAVLDRFPYLVFFEIRGVEIEVVAVAHAKHRAGLLARTRSLTVTHAFGCTGATGRGKSSMRIRIAFEIGSP